MADDQQRRLDRAKQRIDALWIPPTPATRGRPAKVTRAEVVDAAVALADEQGLAAVSMRAVASALGVGAMTLYSHVGNQEELIDAMVDRAHADFEPGPDGAHWRTALEGHARGLWRLYRAHAWLGDINHWRLPLGPHILDVEEAGYRTLVDTGLSAAHVTEVVGIVGNFVMGHAQSVAAEEREAREQGIAYDESWRLTMSFWEDHFDPERYPTMTRLWSSGAFDASGPDEVPLTTLLDSIELLVDKVAAVGADPIPGYAECMARYDDDVDRQREQFDTLSPSGSAQVVAHDDAAEPTGQ